MREIKFRAWSIKDSEMYYPDGNYYFSIDNFSIGFYPRYDKDSLTDYNTNPAEHEKHIIVSQFTGLHDKNGKEIYEGDIMQWPDDSQENGFVIYEESGCQFRIAFKSEYSTSCHIGLNIGDKGQAVVIGNIYENPELLTTKPE